MQHSRPPQIFPRCSSFKKHRSSIDGPRFTIELTLPKPLAPPAWASLPTPPMSGSPPPEQPTEPPQIAGRRRKRSNTPPTATATTIATSPATTLEHTAPRLGAQARGGETIAELPIQPGPYITNYPLPASYQSGSSLGTTPSTSEPRYALSPVSPRAARKPKAHVASACINCKKKHLRCDNARPCRRCVQSGKEESCVDVEHKKRGRPPLKPEDPSARRPFESALSPMGGPLGDPLRRSQGSDPSSFAQSSGYQQRPYRPLQAYDQSRVQMRGPAFQSMYAQPSISSSPATAQGTFTSSRQYPTPGPTPIPGQAPSYGPPQSESALRSIASSYSGMYNYPPPQGPMRPPPQMSYSNPIFPRPPGPPPMQSETLPPLGGPSSLQLPPIRPAATGPIDPAITQQPQQIEQGRHRSQGSSNDGTQEPDSKRPKMDIQGILGPKHE
ncbi:hypothetical protein EDD36DRAFT_303409 [Exophiala viscosa]|uniref:Zn(2)-C6 fungal-type domain-containing protein n=1 Tax=Exophiala viscosa TaxID=2486360 RepID=A0AAN6DSZ4_9EURO|nr:hypothetical protein EDD36DRAFT_303409 [Exophiala viscosa]